MNSFDSYPDDLIDFPLPEEPNCGIPNNILNISLPEGGTFAKDVDELFATYYPENTILSYPTTTTTTTSCSTTPQYQYEQSSFGVKEEQDVTPPIYSIVSTPHTSPQTQQNNYPTFSDEEDDEEVSPARSSRKRKNVLEEVEHNPVKREKVIKRRERNRESAAASRQRKKNHITILEGRVRELKDQRVNLSREISSMEGENKAMRDEISSISTLITTSPLLSGMWNRYNTPERTTTTSIQKDLRHSPAVKAAFFLFLLMFCAFNSSTPVESQTKIAQPLLTTYFNFLATDGNLIPQQQLQELLNIWLQDPLGLESHSRAEFGLNSELDNGFPEFLGELPDLSDLLTETQAILMNSPSGVNSLNEISPSLYDTVYQVVSSSAISSM